MASFPRAKGGTPSRGCFAPLSGTHSSLFLRTVHHRGHTETDSQPLCTVGLVPSYEVVLGEAAVRGPDMEAPRRGVK